MSTLPIRWAELLPHQFLRRLNECPVVYLPLGICEPHGPITAFGLDTIKADYLCDEAARRFGGIVAPTLGYQIHEVSYHAPWLSEVLGDTVRPRMTAMPPHVMLYFFLYQLRAFYNAGFRAAVVISGHSGGNQIDFRRVAAAFSERFGMRTFVASDPELVEGQFTGDHAGVYELSQQLALRPDLVDLSLDFGRVENPELGRFAQGLNAHEATAEMGHAILEASLVTIGQRLAELTANLPDEPEDARPYLHYEPIESLWQEVLTTRAEWYSGQKVDASGMADGSRWRAYV